jgi:YHS domain-containing protein
MKNLLILALSMLVVTFLNLNSYGLGDDDPKTCSKKNKTSCNHEKSGSGSLTEFVSDSTDNDQDQDVTTHVCPMSNKEIGEGEGVTYNYLGIEYTFCSQDCVDEFKSEPMSYIDEKLKCPVMGGAAKQGMFVEYDGVKYYFHSFCF